MGPVCTQFKGLDNKVQFLFQLAYMKVGLHQLRRMELIKIQMSEYEGMYTKVEHAKTNSCPTSEP